ncbi:MAG: hypothetical protein KME52_11820 [Desmonostoc geniculatum HA4340-LM1]|jgi:hypothetical protein|nr:hypothetical protein [Desmonostoc geniculatum HA4340-LM1]
MIPQELLSLACREFPTYNQAIAASHFDGDSVEWAEAPEMPVRSLDENPCLNFQITRRTMRVQQLPSGFWAWIPGHPDDLAIVAEHKRESNKKFGVTLLLTMEQIIAPEMDEQCLQAARQGARRRLAYHFLENIQESKIYRTAYIERIGKIAHYGRIVDKISVGLLYAEEVYSDTPLQEPS